ncbi:PP2C family protein-serine/threonine phosphatase [Lysobacter enzymogenes]|uniref:PP2C family protein-serine/threonine phosphatase n=1 Tax=Lysobacter enzymogenes TaxID=69 RepID=UPI001F52B1AD|nr:PP2C family serine/threonine-protein phosphatase [Lysobacter enzymogenes]UZW58405.1 serine/threonine-protein phosphatase [Lysobacter enzymogenes]
MNAGVLPMSDLHAGFGRFASDGLSDRGKLRDRNEDAILVREDLGLWAVADGLGGHSAGDYASRAVIERLDALQRPHDLVEFIEAIEDALRAVNQELRELAQTRQVDIIASTVVLLVGAEDLAVCGWVGDSRAYGFDGARLAQLTRDHVASYDEDEDPSAPGAPMAGGALTRAIGADDELFVDWAVIARRPGQTFVLCSDGINKEMSDEEIAAECRRHGEPGALARRLLDTALARAGRDNISVVTVRRGGAEP